MGERDLVIGDIPANTNGAAAPTVMIYGHFDVQPPAPLDLWESPPFELDERDGWYYARGIADDKGQLYTLVKAAQLLALAGELPVNIRLACDGEEEIGGHTIVDFLEQDERGTDAAIVFDGVMLGRDMPVFQTAKRGLIRMDVTVRTGERDLHSGLYGGAALNAMHALMQSLSSVLPGGARLPESLRVGTVPPSDEELGAWAELPAGADELERRGARPLLVRAGGTLPAMGALSERGIPVIRTGFGLPESNVHAPNERIPVEYLDRAVRTARELYTELARLPARVA